MRQGATREGGVLFMQKRSGKMLILVFNFRPAPNLLSRACRCGGFPQFPKARRQSGGPIACHSLGHCASPLRPRNALGMPLQRLHFKLSLSRSAAPDGDLRSLSRRIRRESADAFSCGVSIAAIATGTDRQPNLAKPTADRNRRSPRGSTAPGRPVPHRQECPHTASPVTV